MATLAAVAALACNERRARDGPARGANPPATRAASALVPATPAPAVTRPAPRDTSYPRATTGRVVLGEYFPGEVGGSARGERFDLSIPDCGAATCPIEVRLLDASAVRGTARLDWPSASREPTREEAGALWGAGDPLDTVPRVTWATGEEATSVATAARGVTLARGVAALLVTQRGGFEHVKRRHYVFAAVRGRVERVWTGEEPSGLTWSAVITAPGASGVDRLVHYSIASPDASPEAAGPYDDVAVRALTWDGRRLRSSPSGAGAVPLTGVTTIAYPTADAARAARAGRRDCLRGFWVVPATLRDGESSGATLLALTPSAALAAAAVARVRRCAPDARPRTVALRTPFTSGGD